MHTYNHIAAAAHAVGGQTQTEATARMTRLASKSIRFLWYVLADLRREAEACTTEAQYALVREQQVRVREALQKRGAL